MKIQMLRLGKLADQPQHPLLVRLARHLQIKPPDVHPKERRQQPGLVHIRAMSGILIAAWADMHSNPASLLGSEPFQHLVVQCNKAPQQATGRIQLQRQSPLGKVELH